MAEYIKREDAIQAAYLIAIASIYRKITFDDAYKIMNDIPNADVVGRKKGKWIPVTERLPESINEYVLCCGEKGGQFVGWIAEGMIESGKARAFQHGGRGRNITHWMPLPEPPKEETE